MNFEEFIRHVTGQDREPRALKDFKAYLVEYFFSNTQTHRGHKSRKTPNNGQR